MKRDYQTIIEEKKAMLEVIKELIEDTLRHKEWSTPSEWNDETKQFDVITDIEKYTAYDMGKIKAYDTILDMLEKLIK